MCGTTWIYEEEGKGEWTERKKILVKKGVFIYIVWKGGIWADGWIPVFGNVNWLFSLVLRISFVNSLFQLLRNALLSWNADKRKIERKTERTTERETERRVSYDWEALWAWIKIVCDAARLDALQICLNLRALLMWIIHSWLELKSSKIDFCKMAVFLYNADIW